MCAPMGACFRCSKRTLRNDSFTSRAYIPDVTSLRPRTLTCSAFFVSATVGLQKWRNSESLVGRAAATCMTREISEAELRDAVPAEYTDVRSISCGGMSRLYVAGDVIIKITDISRSLGAYEHHRYEHLVGLGLSLPRVYSYTRKHTLNVLAMEKLDFTLATAVIVIAHNPRLHHKIPVLVFNISVLLNQLRAAGITYCDLSPDNIMCRASAGGDIELVLIDPQFAVETDVLAKEIGLNWARSFDRVHLALKMCGLIATAMPTMRAVARHICIGLLGYEPDPLDARAWLTHKLPIGLRVAHNILLRQHSV